MPRGAGRSASAGIANIARFASRGRTAWIRSCSSRRR
jgi:hypothetical protein